MSVVYRAAEIEQLAVSPGATIYTAPAGTTSIVTFANCTNESASSETFTIHIVQSGGSLADTNIYADTLPLGQGVTKLVTNVLGAILDPGDFIIAFGSTADALNLKLGIKEIS